MYLSLDTEEGTMTLSCVEGEKLPNDERLASLLLLLSVTLQAEDGEVESNGLILTSEQVRFLITGEKYLEE